MGDGETHPGMVGAATKAGVVQLIPGAISADSKPSHRGTSSSLPETRLKMGAEAVSCHLCACVPTCSHLL